MLDIEMIMHIYLMVFPFWYSNSKLTRRTEPSDYLIEWKRYNHTWPVDHTSHQLKDAHTINVDCSLIWKLDSMPREVVVWALFFLDPICTKIKKCTPKHGMYRFEHRCCSPIWNFQKPNVVYLNRVCLSREDQWVNQILKQETKHETRLRYALFSVC